MKTRTIKVSELIYIYSDPSFVGKYEFTVDDYTRYIDTSCTSKLTQIRYTTEDS